MQLRITVIMENGVHCSIANDNSLGRAITRQVAHLARQIQAGVVKESMLEDSMRRQMANSPSRVLTVVSP